MNYLYSLGAFGEEGFQTEAYDSYVLYDSLIPGCMSPISTSIAIVDSSPDIGAPSQIL